MNEEVKISLTEAGIGPRYHSLTLGDIPDMGPGLLAYIRKNGGEISKAGKSVVFHGVGLTDAMTLLARAFHIHGFGVKICPLVRLSRIMKDPEFRETILEIPILSVTNCQDIRMSNPLQGYVHAEIEQLIRDRHSLGRSTWLQMAVDENVVIRTMPNCFWSEEFMHLVTESFDVVKRSALVRKAK